MRPFRAALVAALLAAPFGPGQAHAAQPATWNFGQIRIGQSQVAGHNGSGVTVAVIDTWVDYTHPDLGGRVLAGADCTGGSCKPGKVAPDKCEAHGTHVAGTIASQTYGVAPAARILPLRVLKWTGSECAGTSNDLAVAVRYATAHGARIVNISAGASVPLAGHDTMLDDAVSAAAQAGVLVVFAAGNANLPVADSYGGDALIVAATGRDGKLASYSQHGTGVDLAAPGGDPPTDTCTVTECIVSTWSSGTVHQYAALAGTSMAAPHVAGIAALLFAQKPRSRADVIARLRDTAHPLANAGDGIVDAAAALGASGTAPGTPAKSPAPAPAVVLKPKPAATPRPAASPTPKPKPKPKPRHTHPPSAAPATTPPAIVEPPLAAASSRTTRTVPATAAALLVALTAAGTAGAARRQGGAA
jgi:subtilisin family serine protease